MAEVRPPVIVAGAGPVGLSLALGLARHGVRTVVLEREAALPPFSRALGVLPRTMEVFRSWGVLDAFLAKGTLKKEIGIYVAGRDRPAAVIDLKVLARHTAVPGVLILSQSRTEAILLRQAQETGLADIRFGHEVKSFREASAGEAGAAGVAVQVANSGGDEHKIEGDFLIGCDGAHSTVRQQLGWQLEGKTYPARVALADVRLTDDRDMLPWPRLAAFGAGGMAALRFEPQHWRIIRPLAESEPDEVVLGAAGQAAMVERLFGPGPFETLWASVFRIHCRTSPHFRRGRVLLAGDAAHINSPAGGQGMNAGIQDAHNLAWKLARTLEGGADALLASYEQERRAAVLSNVDQTTDFLTRTVLLGRPWFRALFFGVARAAISLPFVFEQVALRAGMLDTHYPTSDLLQGSGRWLGRRAPDGDLLAPDGTRQRLLDLVEPDAALLLFDDGRLPSWNTAEIQADLAAVRPLRVVRLVQGDGPEAASFRDPDGAVWRAWSATGDLAALVRPDGFVGWMARHPAREELRAGVAAALGA